MNPELKKYDIPALKRIALLLPVLIVIVIGLAAYASSFSNDFVWDDTYLIKGNKHIEGFQNIKHIFKEDLFYMTLDIAPAGSGYYRPIQTLSYIVDYSLWARRPLGYHLTSFIIHILNAVIVFYLCLLIMGDKWKSCFVASAFSAHPAFVPVVAYVSGRADLLGLFFSLLAIYLAIGYIAKTRGKYFIWLSVLCYALAVLSKEYYVITPLFIIAYFLIYRDDAIADRNVKTGLLSMALIFIAYLVLRAAVFNFHPLAVQEYDIPLWIGRVIVFPYLLTCYIWALVFPVNLGMEKKLLLNSFAEPRFPLSYITLFAIIAIFCYFYKKKQRITIFWLAWFAISLIPISHIFIPLEHIWAEHWTYMASIGFFAFLVSAGDALYRGPGSRKYALLAVMIIAFFIALTINESKYWKNDEAFYARTLKRSPHSAKALYNLGRVYKERGDRAKALLLFDKAIAESLGRKPLYFLVRGRLHKDMRDFTRAQQDFETVLRFGPSPMSARAAGELAVVYEMQGNIKKAIETYGVAIGLTRTNKSGYYNSLGLLYKKMGDHERARDDFESAAKMNPSVAAYHNNLAVECAELKMYERARAELKEALRLDPANDSIKRNIMLLETKTRPRGAGGQEDIDAGTR